MAVRRGPAPVHGLRHAGTPPDVAPQRFRAPVNNYDRILEIARNVAALDGNAVTYVRSSTAYTEVWRATKASQPLQDLYDELLLLLDAPNAVPYDPETDANEAYEAN